jgi:hypothetical protein
MLHAYLPAAVQWHTHQPLLPWLWNIKCAILVLLMKERLQVSHCLGTLKVYL